MEIGILLLRVTVGLTLAAHGAQKLFGWFGSPGLDAIGQGMEMLGFRPGRRHALMAGVVEFGAGALLTLGLATPAGAALGASVMLVAAVTAHVKNGFFLSGGGYEYTLVLGAAALSIAFIGAGAVSIDALLGYSFGGVSWGVAALLTTLAGAGIQLAQRRVPRAQQATAAA